MSADAQVGAAGDVRAYTEMTSVASAGSATTVVDDGAGDPVFVVSELDAVSGAVAGVRLECGDGFRVSCHRAVPLANLIN